MNITQHINFTEEKPAVLAIRSSEKSKIIAVGLLKDQVLKKHKTTVPAFLTVLTGAIEFRMAGNNYTLQQYDTFEIPVDVLHEVVGLYSKNVFTVMKEL